MFDILIKRICLSSQATWGVVLYVEPVSKEWTPFAVTLEKPWLNNQHGISCIPTGIYVCKRDVRPLHGECFEVTNVPNRTDILIHSGNVVADTEGCIILGEEYGQLDHVSAVLSSKRAMTEFFNIVEGINEFRLTIKEV